MRKAKCCSIAAGALAIVFLMNGGCTHRGGPFDQWIRAEDKRLWSEPPSIASQLSNPASEPLPAVTDPDEYIKIAMQHNPEVLAAQQRVAAMAQRIPQVTSLDDPMFEITPIGDMAETAAGSVDVMTGISQRFPLGGKLSTAGKVAESEVASAIAELDAVKVRIAGDVKQAYWLLYEKARAVEFIAANRSILQQLVQAVDAQYRTGQGNQADVLRASTELKQLDAQRIELESQANAAKARLNGLMNRRIDAEIPPPPEIEPSALFPQLNEVLASAMQHNPKLRQMESMIEADRQRAKLAQLQRIPDLNVSLAYNAVSGDGLSPVANGDDQWWLGFGINLPIWQDRLDAAEREAKLNVLRNVSALAGERNAVAYQLRSSVLAAESALRRAQLFKNEIIPQAKQSLDASLSGYQAGSIDFSTLATNWQRLLEFNLMLHENVAAFQRASAEIDQVIGVPPEGSQQTQTQTISSEGNGHE